MGPYAKADARAAAVSRHRLLKPNNTKVANQVRDPLAEARFLLEETTSSLCIYFFFQEGDGIVLNLYNYLAIDGQS